MRLRPVLAFALLAGLAAGGSLVAPALQAAAPGAPVAAAPGSWTADPAKSTLEFTFVQAGAATTGHFARFTANVDFRPDALDSARIEANIDIASVDTRDKDRDTQLRAPELFDVMKFPRARYVATHVTGDAKGYRGEGQLSLRGITRDVPIEFTFQTLTEEGQPVTYLKGTATVPRLAFGVGQGEWKSTEWIGDEVKVAFDLRLQPRAR